MGSGDIDHISEALGRIEANITNLQESGKSTGSDVKSIKDEIAQIKQNCAANGSCSLSRTQVATWGAGAATFISAMFEGLRHVSSK